MQAQSLTPERLVALFLLAVLLLMPPLLIIFNKATLILGVPMLFLYLFVAWTALIALVAFVVERRDDLDDITDASTDLPGKEPRPATRGPADA